MKFFYLATVALIGSQAININKKYHDDYDNTMPTAKDVEEGIANGTLPNTTAGSNSSATGINCTAFLNSTLEDLDSNFTALFKNFTDARAPVAVKAGNQTVNATSNPNFVNATLLDADDITNLTVHMKNMTDFLVKYKKRLVTDGDITDVGVDLDTLSKKNVTAIKNYVGYVQKVLLETPLLKYAASNFTDSKLRESPTVVLTNTTLNVNASSNRTQNESRNATTTYRSVVSDAVTQALNKLDNEADKMVNLDSSTYHNVYLAWDRYYISNGTIAARAAAINATKNHTFPNATNKTDFSNDTCSMNNTRYLNATNNTTAAAPDADAAALAKQATPANALKVQKNAAPAAVKKATPPVVKK